MTRFLIPMAVCAALAACSSTPTPRFHSLLGAQPASEAAAPAFAVDLGPVGVPASVDQPQWVLRFPDDSLRVLEQERWVAPLRDEFRSALLHRWVQRWGGVDARTMVGTATLPVWRVRVDVTRMESAVGRESWLEATWSLTPAARGGEAIACTSIVRESSSGDALDLAAAHRRAVVRLADEIGAVLAMRAKGQAAGCQAAG
jgi:uncharacterized protein